MLDRREVHDQGAITTIRVDASTASGRALCLDEIGDLQDTRTLVLDLTATGTGFGDPLMAPSLDTLCRRIEALPIPVIAACGTEISGDRLALALAAHYRLAPEEARLHSGEQAPGLVAAGGVVVRLTRVAGLALAERLLLQGETVPAPEAAAARLIDKTISTSPVEAATVFARIVLERALGPRPSAEEERGLAGGWARVAAMATRYAAMPALLEVLQGAFLLPVQAALDLSETLAEETRRTDSAQSALHLSRARARMPRGTAPRHLACLGLEDLEGLVGDLAGGHLVSGGQLTLVAGTEAEARELHARFDPEHHARLTVTLDPPAIAKADAALVCLPLALEQQTILAGQGPVSTPTALVTPLPVGVAREVLRLFDKPVLVQVRHGKHLLEASLSDPAHAAPIAALAALHGYQMIARSADLPIGDRLVARLRWAAQVLLEEGAHVAQIDRAMTEAGYAAPVFATLDAEGLDTPRTMILEQMGPVRDARGAALPAILRAAGRTGAAAGQGYYMHGDDGATEDPALDHVLAQIRAKRQIEPREVSDAEIVAVLHAALVNGALELVEAGQPADTVDLAAVALAGFPADSGGPLFAADRAGLIALRRAASRMADAAPRAIAPHPAWVDAIKYGRRFCPVY